MSSVGMDLLRAGAVLTNVHASLSDNYPCQVVSCCKILALQSSEPSHGDMKSVMTRIMTQSLVHLQIQVRVALLCAPHVSTFCSLKTEASSGSRKRRQVEAAFTPFGSATQSYWGECRADKTWRNPQPRLSRRIGHHKQLHPTLTRILGMVDKSKIHKKVSTSLLSTGMLSDPHLNITMRLEWFPRVPEKR